jgi:hypothetical protein
MQGCYRGKAIGQWPSGNGAVLLSPGRRYVVKRLVHSFGEMWARDLKNINKIPGSKTPRGGEGVYILYDGSMPVYVGKGHVKTRIYQARRSKSRGPFWDHFSWYVLDDPEMIDETEVLILRMLPPYLRSLTKQKGHFQKAVRDKSDEEKVAEFISRKLPKRRKKKK